MKINIGNNLHRKGYAGSSQDKSVQDIDYIYENYRPAGSSSLYKKRSQDNRWIFQLLVSGGVLLVMLGLFKVNIPFTEPIKNGVKYVMSSETNIRPIFSKIIDLAAQSGNIEWPLIDDAVPVNRQTISDLPLEGPPMTLPVSGNLVKLYGWNYNQEEGVQSFHEGIDIAVPVGTEVNASAPGKVITIGEEPSLGKFILIKTDNGDLMRYAELSEILVQKEQLVKAGDTVGKSGAPEKGVPHLHFETIVNGKPVDPIEKLGMDLTNINGIVKPDEK